MNLYLVRHAVAFEQDGLRWPDDRERPLTPEGERKFQKAAKGLREVAGDVDVLLSSPWTRAWRTAEIARKRADWPSPVACGALAGDREPREVLDALLEYAGAAHVALVGHAPHLDRLAGLLLSGAEDAAPFALTKGGAACVRVEVDDGGGVAPRSGRLRWLLSQKLLRALA